MKAKGTLICLTAGIFFAIALSSVTAQSAAPPTYATPNPAPVTAPPVPEQAPAQAAVAEAAVPPAQPTAPAAQAAVAAEPAGAAPAANPAAPPSESPKKSAAELQGLVAPIALYPDPLIATILPASAYPLEVVQAARFVKDTNNIAKLDQQQWDDNVKAVARIPEVISQMDSNITWTTDLGDAFINQPKDVMDAIQAMRGKAQEKGSLKTTEQQIVNVEPQVVTNYVEQQPVIVTNEVVTIEPSNPEVIYVPQYNPTVVYASPPPPYPSYYYPPYYPGMYAGPLLTFGAGMAVGAAIWGNGCDWGHGDVNINQNFNQSINRNTTANRPADRQANANQRQGDRQANRQGGQKWQPDQNRLKNSGSGMASGQNREARGYGGQAGGAGAAGNRQAAVQNASQQARTQQAANRAGGAQAGAGAANRAAGGAAANRAGGAQAADR